MVSLVLGLGGKPCWKDECGSTPMHAAAINGHASVVSDLIDAGGDANARDRLGRTPLHDAAYHCRQEVILTLVRRGANVAAVDVDRRDALSIFLTSPLRKKGSEADAHLSRVLSGSRNSPAAVAPKSRGRLDL